MDNSKMAKAGTEIKYDAYKSDYGQEQMSRPVKQKCHNHCYDEDCHCERGLDDVLSPPTADPHEVCCEPTKKRKPRRELS